MRSKALSNVRAFAYRLLAINAKATKDQLVDTITSTLYNALLNDSRTTISEMDIINICEDVVNSPLPSNIRDWLYSKRRTEWKKDIRELLELTDSEKMKFEGIKDKKERELWLSKLVADKKRNEALRCIRELNEEEKVLELLLGIEAIMETPECGELSYKSLSDLLGVSYPTIKKYSEKLMDSIDSLKELGLLSENKVKALAERNEEALVNACYDIHEAREIITKMKLHRRTNISRPTIDRNYKDESVRLGDFVNQLNSNI